MKIEGFQTLTLLDYPGRMACTVFTPGCDFRCPFCHNASLVLPGRAGVEVPEAEVFALLKKRRGVLDGVCVTGGEPTLQPGLSDFLRRIKELGYAVKLDTNGARPDVLRSLAEKGLVDYVAMDIKNAPERYAETAGVPGLDLAPIRESADFLRTGSLPFEFRTTVVRPLHNSDSFRAIGEWLAGEEPYFLQGFQDSGDLIGTGLSPFGEEEMIGFRSILSNFIPNTALRGI
ncbi:MAG: anaerobic ribonucleoside-triphosphate reductase activating protein [Pseudoflavonifractor sp.]|nr:anaerobic ribonucleoside-triphosphate reductase activating protein [Pseudoflavonifractor sp.]